MSLLAASDLFLEYDGKLILDGDSVAVERKDRLGVVGPNGSGKSTLLKILAGKVEPERGRVVGMRGLRVGYLAQDPIEGGAAGLLESVLAAAPRKAALAERVELLERDLDAATDADQQADLSAELADLHQELTDLERQFAPHLAQRILVGLGFRAGDFDQPLASFSGGWRMRAALAALLFQQPEVLLLDEPTNHLDLPSVHWMNRFLAGFPHAVVLICHDREFLNRHVKRIASFEVEGLRHYRGNYDEYRRLRALELETLENKQRRDEARKAQLEAFITRFRAKASKARQAQSKQRMIERLQEDAVDLPEIRKTIRIQFRPAPPCGDPVLEIAGLGHCYGEKRIFSGVELTVRRGARIALVGQNGAGKTTLLKLIAGELPLVEGTIKQAAHVKRGYFAQHHAEILDRQRTVLEEVGRVVPNLRESEVRGICGAFLFGGDDVDKRIGVLSGGERTRVALARLLIDPGNLLLLDEPTNHLDTDSAEKLTESLASYDGTMLFVSHNLDFAKSLSTVVWDVRDGGVHVYPGSLADYLDRLTAAEDAAASGFGGALGSAEPEVAERQQDKAARVRAREELVQRRRERARLEKRLLGAEASLAALEAEQGRLERELADPGLYEDKARSEAAIAAHVRAKGQVAEAFAEWERLAAELEALPGEEAG